MNITVYEGSVKHELPFKEGETILTVLQNAGIRSITAPCGGNGSCGKCGVNVRSGTGSVLRLACMVPAGDGMTSFSDAFTDAFLLSRRPGFTEEIRKCSIR